MLRAQKFRGDCVIEKRHQSRVEPIHVEKSDRLRVHAELRPRPDFEDFFERAEASGKCHEGIGERGHLRLALVHGVDDVQLAETAMPDLARPERVRNHADDFAAVREHRVRELTHQSNAAAAVHERDAFAREQRTDAARGIRVNRIAARIRATENAKPSDRVTELHGCIVAQGPHHGLLPCRSATLPLVRGMKLLHAR